MLLNLFKKSAGLSDQELIAAYKRTGKADYIARLYIRYTNLVTALCLKYLKDETDAEDASMEVFEIICRDLKKHEVQNTSAWLYSVVKNHCLKTLRQKRKMKTYSIDDENSSFHFMENHLNDDLHKKEQLEIELNQLEEVLTKLKGPQKECVQRFYLKKESYKEISDNTGYPLKKVKSYIQNGKRKLKIELEKVQN